MVIDFSCTSGSACEGKMVVKCNDKDVFVTPKRRSSGLVEDKHETASRLMLVGIALKQKDQLKNVIRSGSTRGARPALLACFQEVFMGF